MNIPKDPVRIGIVGTGKMGKNHVRVAIANPRAICEGVFDPNETSARATATSFGCRQFSSLPEMLDNVDAVIIASPTISHFEIGKTAIQKGVHCLIEKPLAATLAEAEQLIQLAEKHSVKLSVGHIERHNPLFPELQKILLKEEVLAIQASRLSYNTTRANDVDVVLDLMIHDIDTISALLEGGLTLIGATGNAYHSPNNDYVTALFTTGKGVIVSLVGSKVSQTKSRSLQISCSDSFISVDYLRKEIEIHRHATTRFFSDDMDLKYTHESLVERVLVPAIEPLMAEHTDFVEAVVNDRNPLVSGVDGFLAMKLAEEIQVYVAKRSD